MGRPFLPRPLCKICGNRCNHRRSQFCSRVCKGKSEIGIAKPYAKGNQYGYRGENVGVWAHYKRMQKIIPKAPCSICGSEKHSIIHHIDHDPKNTTKDNLIRMCRPCHARHHTKERMK